MSFGVLTRNFGRGVHPDANLRGSLHVWLQSTRKMNRFKISARDP